VQQDTLLFSIKFTKCLLLIVGSSPDRVKPKAMKLVFVASPLSTQHSGERAKTGWLGIRIMCQSGTTCQSADCCFSELALYKSN